MFWFWNCFYCTTFFFTDIITADLSFISWSFTFSASETNAHIYIPFIHFPRWRLKNLPINVLICRKIYNRRSFLAKFVATIRSIRKYSRLASAWLLTARITKRAREINTAPIKRNITWTSCAEEAYLIVETCTNGLRREKNKIPSPMFWDQSVPPVWSTPILTLVLWDIVPSTSSKKNVRFN